MCSFPASRNHRLLTCTRVEHGASESLAICSIYKGRGLGTEEVLAMEVETLLRGEKRDLAK